MVSKAQVLKAAAAAGVVKATPSQVAEFKRLIPRLDTGSLGLMDRNNLKVDMRALLGQPGAEAAQPYLQAALTQLQQGAQSKVANSLRKAVQALEGGKLERKPRQPKNPDAPKPHAKPLRLTKDGGRYTYKIRNTTYEVHQNLERDSSWYGEWIISNQNDPNDYGDPVPTLGECRRALAAMEADPDLYGIK